MVARKKTTTRKKAVARRKSTAVAVSNWEEKLAEEASAASARTGAASESNIISIKGGKFKFKDENLGDEMEVVVLEYAYAREYYDSAFDPDNPAPPACFGLGESIDDVTGPDEKSPAPQATTCEECEWNEWGSSNFGKSKACGSKAILVVADYSGVTDENYEHAIMRIGVNSMLNWNAYVKNLERKTKRPPFGVVTRMVFDKDSDNPILKFHLGDMIDDDEALEAIMGRRDGLMEELTTPHYNVEAYEPPAPKRGRTKKKVTKKRRSKFSKECLSNMPPHVGGQFNLRG